MSEAAGPPRTGSGLRNYLIGCLLAAVLLSCAAVGVAGLGVLGARVSDTGTQLSSVSVADSTAISSDPEATPPGDYSDTIQNAESAPSDADPASDARAPSARALESMPNVTVVYYDIAGSSVSELRSQMRDRGPAAPSGERFDGWTNWQFNWTWPGYGTSVCSLAEAEVTYGIEVTLPRWTPPSGTSDALKATWAKYSEALALHEKGHVDLVLKHSGSVAAAIKSGSCDTAEADARAALERIQRLNDSYDDSTDHGATQGARLR